MIETTSPPPFHRNRKAGIGFILAIFALLALCIGFLPIFPFTAPFCYPLGLLLGIASLVLGLQAQREIRITGEGGRMLALISIWVGIFTILALICLITAAIILVPHIIEWFTQITPQPSP